MIIFLTENENIENYSVSSKPIKIDEIDDISNSISDNISKEIKIPADVLNSFAIIMKHVMLFLTRARTKDIYLYFFHVFSHFFFPTRYTRYLTRYTP